jgi:hypothetical protein
VSREGSDIRFEGCRAKERHKGQEVRVDQLCHVMGGDELTGPSDRGAASTTNGNASTSLAWSYPPLLGFCHRMSRADDSLECR